MKNFGKQRLFEMMEVINSDFKTSSDHFREINQEKNARRETNRYTTEEAKEIHVIENELEKLGLENRVDFSVEPPQDQMGTKMPRFEFDFYIDKLKEKLGSTNIDSLLTKTNLDVLNPMVGSAVHGYIVRRLNLKK
jgi:hypothetical protein